MAQPSERLKVGDALTSKKDGCQYRITQVRCQAGVIHYLATDNDGWCITVYPNDLDRFNITHIS